MEPLYEPVLTHSRQLGRDYQSVDSLQNVSSVTLVVVGVLVTLVAFLHLHQKCIQSGRGYLWWKRLSLLGEGGCVMCANLVSGKQVMPLEELVSNVPQRLLSGQSLSLKDGKVPIVQCLQRVS